MKDVFEFLSLNGHNLAEQSQGAECGSSIHPESTTGAILSSDLILLCYLPGERVREKGPLLWFPLQFIVTISYEQGHDLVGKNHDALVDV